MRDEIFTAASVEAALRLAAVRLGMAVADLRYVVLEREAPAQRGLQATPARVAVLLDRPAPRPAAPERSAPRPPATRHQRPETEPETETEPHREPPGDPAARARAVVATWAEAAALDVGAEVVDDGASLVVQIVGSDRQELSDGELDGLCHLLERASAARRDVRRAVVVECGGRRLGRTEALQQEIRRKIAAVREEGRPLETEPLNAYERRIVHMTVRDEAGVTSFSVGEGHERRVTIAPLPPGGGAEVM